MPQKRAWFKPYGWIYYPKSFQGIIFTLLMLAFCVQVFAAVDRHSHSVSGTLYGIFPYWAPSFGLWLWIASKTSDDVDE